MTKRAMRRWIGCGWAALLLAACSDSDPHAAPVTTVAPPSPVMIQVEPPTSSPIPVLESVTAPYMSLVALLDGVCFEFLAGLSGQSWLWTTPDDLAAFYNRVDESKLCTVPITRGSYDFNGTALAGAIHTAVGCDAAYRVIRLVQDNTAYTQTLYVEFDIAPGCSYELVQPLLIAVPRPPDGYTLQVAVSSAP